MSKLPPTSRASRALVLFAWCAACAMPAIHAHAQAPAASPPPEAASNVARVDAVFASYDSTATPGCAIAVAKAGTPVLERAYGMADLERQAVNSPATIFEAGSVSKQFTAAAVLLLARDGKLSLDDSVRKYFPELPEVNSAVTIRHMLQHTSGLRDWGEIAALSGWPRTTRAYTHQHVLDILARQGALNFVPGTDWNYSNSGYNLAAMLVGRVSGLTFAEFTRRRLFEPAGMWRTSWRDDYMRVVPGRAVAYDVDEGRIVTLMPFEDVHGNGGLLTTVGDLLRWNAFLESGRFGDQAMTTLQETPGRLANGATHGYAFGLNVGEYKGLREISHGGATAGYRAYLMRYPTERLSVALLCNAGTVNADGVAHQVADVFLGPAAKAEPPVVRPRLDEGEAARLVGEFKGGKRGDMLTVVRDGDGVRVERGAPLVPAGQGRFSYGRSIVEVSPGAGAPVARIRVVASNGTEDVYERVARAAPTVERLGEYAGVYRTAEVDSDYEVAVDGTGLLLKRRPGVTMPLRPLYADAFDSRIGLVRFVRDAAGRVTLMRVATGRAWDVRFARVIEPGTAARAR